jgi:hypothetical protein
MRLRGQGSLDIKEAASFIGFREPIDIPIRPPTLGRQVVLGKLFRRQVRKGRDTERDCWCAFSHRTRFGSTRIQLFNLANVVGKDRFAFGPFSRIVLRTQGDAKGRVQARESLLGRRASG